MKELERLSNIHPIGAPSMISRCAQQQDPEYSDFSANYSWQKRANNGYLLALSTLLCNADKKRDSICLNKWSSTMKQCLKNDRPFVVRRVRKRVWVIRVWRVFPKVFHWFFAATELDVSKDRVETSAAAMWPNITMTNTQKTKENLPLRASEHALHLR